MRHRPEPATDHDTESASLAAVGCAHSGNESQVVHHRAAASERVVSASRVRDLELATEVLNISMSEKELRLGIGVRRDVEGFVMADTGVRTAGHVADGVAARFARRDSDARQ